MKTLYMISRDNARTPMQWDDSENAGFTKAVPWIDVNPVYREINAAAQINNTGSVFSFYRTLIKLRHTDMTIVYGRFKLLMPDDKRLFVYTRTLDGSSILVVCNFTGGQVPVSPPGEYCKGRVLISNYTDSRPSAECVRPYEAFAVEIPV